MSNEKRRRIGPSEFNKPLILGVFGLIMILLSITGKDELIPWVMAIGLLCVAGAILIWLIEAKFVKFWDDYDS